MLIKSSFLPLKGVSLIFVDSNVVDSISVSSGWLTLGSLKSSCSILIPVKSVSDGLSHKLSSCSVAESCNNELLL